MFVRRSDLLGGKDLQKQSSQCVFGCAFRGFSPLPPFFVVLESPTEWIHRLGFQAVFSTPGLSPKRQSRRRYDLGCERWNLAVHLLDALFLNDEGHAAAGESFLFGGSSLFFFARGLKHKLRWYPQQLGAEGQGFVCSLRLRLQFFTLRLACTRPPCCLEPYTWPAPDHPEPPEPALNLTPGLHQTTPEPPEPSGTCLEPYTWPSPRNLRNLP